jgi:hemoglobin
MTLYDRIGGAPAVNAAVERFYVRVLADPMLEAFFKDIDMARLKTHQFAFLSQTLGGPQKYSGASMRRAHSRLRIEQRHFDAVAAHLVETLRDLGVSESLVAEVAAIVTPLASQVVNTAGAAGA